MNTIILKEFQSQLKTEYKKYHQSQLHPQDIYNLQLIDLSWMDMM